MITENEVIEKLLENEADVVDFYVWCCSQYDVFEKEVKALDTFLKDYLTNNLDSDEVMTVRISPSDYPLLDLKLEKLKGLYESGIISKGLYNKVKIKLSQKTLQVSDFLQHILFLFAYTDIYPLLGDIDNFMQESVELGYNLIKESAQDMEKVEIMYTHEDARSLDDVIRDNIMSLVVLIYSDMYGSIVSMSRDYSLLKTRVKAFQSRLKVNLYTSSNWSFNQGIKQAMKKAGFKKYRYSAILDSRTSEICENLNNKVFLLKDAKEGVNYPPMHRYCRSSVIPVLE